MLREVVTGTSIIYVMMILVAAVGVTAKIVNHVTLGNLMKASGNMQKSTHKLIKLVRSKYEHACMLHDRVENVEAFVEKYIYEYQGILFQIHTWRQLEIQTIWFTGILGFIGASCWYLESGICEELYQYGGLGAVQMVLLYVVSQISDEQYKIDRIKNYMVDYLENVCMFRHRKIRSPERERIEVIQTESGKNRSSYTENASARAKFSEVPREMDEKEDVAEPLAQPAQEEQNLSIRIEGEPRKAGRGELAKKVFGKQDREVEETHSSMQEETLRKILEEFLA